MHGDVISPELALVDSSAAAAHRSDLPVVVVDSAIAAALVARRSVAPAPGGPGRVEIAFSLPIWLAAAAYVALKVATAVLVAMLLVGSVALVATVLPV